MTRSHVLGGVLVALVSVLVLGVSSLVYAGLYLLLFVLSYVRPPHTPVSSFSSALVVLGVISVKQAPHLFADEPLPFPSNGIAKVCTSLCSPV
jgi:hypothetical protein